MFLKIKNIIGQVLSFFSRPAGNRIVFLALCSMGIGALWYVGRQVDLINIGTAIKTLSFLQILSLLVFVFGIVFISAVRWYIILRGFGYRESLWRLMKRITKASAVSFVVPSFEISSETFKGMELQRHGISVPASFASVFFDFILILIVNIGGGSLLLLHVLFQGLFRAEWAFAGACVVLVSCFFLLRRILKPGTLSRFLVKCIPLNEKSVEAVQLFDYGLSFFVKESRKYLILASLITVIGFVWELAQIFLILSFLGVHPSVTQVFVFYLVIYFFNGVPAFGGLGFGEAGAFLSGSILGVPDHISLSLAVLLRARQIIILVLGGSFFMVTAIKEALAKLRA
ncbi:MAG: hypothetical protein UX65_C0006G0012 [Parcubacteria group bacterium GW2011_GWB1_46_8]|nr:MAG: hypothetical protein UX14_C0007G0027 [Parcubacteria group bacterium GW2011_GWF1_45_5]KKU11322.1 MAG: hypothetical protein UX15_C0009G0003 [Parcubacteria group bacterium GW2011_GWA1_45_7]KKU43949.1 MAG: hypothetical protein UX61_C0008G0033 [Parcubacteria group bacterium GW2011_GWA2_46_7]KKU46247.1 MAG: hypothetical protein UX65_C0006G0012 [Parcubacteria group bacterium GW2011_GWB1_46_8]